MNSELKNLALDRFFEFYRNDVESEVVDANNVVLSFPVHFSGFHRIEITVTRASQDKFIISDGSRTIDELKMAGYTINKNLREKIETITRSAQLRIVNNYLLTDTNLKDLGSSIQRFVEATKTIGDAYLVHKASAPRDKELLDTVSRILYGYSVPFQIRHTLQGKIEDHTIDFFFPPNGVPGLALSVVGNPSKMAAEAWAFKLSDIRMTNDRVKVGVVYNSDETKESSKNILQHSADMSIPSTELEGGLRGELTAIGILKRP